MRWPVVVVALGLVGCTLLTDLDDLSGAAPPCEGPACHDGGASDDGARDAGVDGELVEAGAVTPIRFVQVGTASDSAPQVMTRIAPTQAGSLLVVAVAQNIEVTRRVQRIGDDALGGSSTYVSTNLRAVADGCGNALELWYAKDVAEGVRDVTVTMDASSIADVWVLEFAGLSTTEPFDTGKESSHLPQAKTVHAPAVTPSSARALVVSVAVSCRGVYPAEGDAFVSPAPENGHDVAYLIASEPGSYGASWESDDAFSCASTAAFH